jgi:hypothetical protein
MAQLRRALLYHARWYAVLQLHATESSPMDRVVAAFMEIAYQEEFPARREVIRATHEPTYLADALGRMQILELRKDYREHLEEQGASFSLTDFHDRLLELGLPFALATEALIPSRNPPADRRSAVHTRFRPTGSMAETDAPPSPPPRRSSAGTSPCWTTASSPSWTTWAAMRMSSGPPASATATAPGRLGQTRGLIRYLRRHKHTTPSRWWSSSSTCACPSSSRASGSGTARPT